MLGKPSFKKENLYYFLSKQVPVPGANISLLCMNQLKVANDCYRLNGKESYFDLFHKEIFSGVIVVCKFVIMPRRKLNGEMS